MCALRAQMVTDALAHVLHVVAKADGVEVIARGVVSGEAGAVFGQAFNEVELTDQAREARGLLRRIRRLC